MKGKNNHKMTNMPVGTNVIRVMTNRAAKRLQQGKRNPKGLNKGDMPNHKF